MLEKQKEWCAAVGNLEKELERAKNKPEEKEKTE